MVKFLVVECPEGVSPKQIKDALQSILDQRGRHPLFGENMGALTLADVKENRFYRLGRIEMDKNPFRIYWYDLYIHAVDGNTLDVSYISNYGDGRRGDYSKRETILAQNIGLAPSDEGAWNHNWFVTDRE